MSTSVASLHATIGADTRGFEQGARRVKGELGALAPGIEDVRGKLTNFVGANAGLITVLGGVAAGVNKAMNDYARYAAQVRDVTLATGGSAEESSRLLQVLDDFEIEMGDITAATRAMKEKGLVPTIDTLANLSAQYIAIQDPAERLQFAQENLGRSYSKYLNVLAQGPDALRKLNAGVSQNLILSDEDIRKSEELRLAKDELNDAILGLEVSISQDLTPAIMGLAQHIDITTHAMNLAKEAGVNWLTATIEQRNHFIELAKAEATTTSATGSLTDAVLDHTAATLDNSGALEGLTTDYGSLISTMQSIQSETDNYKETQASLREEMAALKQEYQDGNIAQEEYREKIGEITGAMQANEQAHIQAGKSIAFSLVQQKMAVDGLSDTEFKALTAIGVQWGIFDQQVADAAINMDAAAGNIAASASDFSAALKDPVSRITTLNGKIEATAAKSGMMWDFYFNIHTTGRVPNLPAHSQEAATMSIGGGDTYASGGYGLSELAVGEMASVGEIGEEGIIRTRQGLFVIPNSKWRTMKTGWQGRGFASGGGLSHGGGPLTGDDLRQARIEQRMKRDDFGGGLGSSTSTGSLSTGVSTQTAVPAGVSIGATTVTGMAQAAMAAQSAQVLNSVQSNKELHQINNKLETLISVTATARDIGHAVTGQNNKYT